MGSAGSLTVGIEENTVDDKMQVEHGVLEAGMPDPGSHSGMLTSKANIGVCFLASRHSPTTSLSLERVGEGSFRKFVYVLQQLGNTSSAYGKYLSGGELASNVAGVYIHICIYLLINVTLDAVGGPSQ